MFSGKWILYNLREQADMRIIRALRPRTSASYMAAFRQFVAFVIVTGLNIPYSEVVVILYLEYLVQQGLKCCSIRNHVSVLKHYFAMYNWPIAALSGRKVSLLLKSVQVNARMSIKLKDIIILAMLEKLIKKTRMYVNGDTFVALFVTAFFGFFRLSILLPIKSTDFDRTRFPIQNDIVWGAPGVAYHNHLFQDDAGL